MKTRKMITIGGENYELTDTFLSRVLEAAVEGGCSYWADVSADYEGEAGGADGALDFDVTDYIDDEEDEDTDDENEMARENESDVQITSASFLSSKDPAQGGTIDLEGIADAIGRITNGEVEIAPAIRETIIAAVQEDDASEIDEETADCIVQIGLFDEIVYS